VASVWTTVWACGQLLGPLIGGLMMDTLPKARELGCVESDGELSATERISLCRTAFAWSATLWGGMGFLLAYFLGVSLVWMSWHPVPSTDSGRKVDGQELGRASPFACPPSPSSYLPPRSPVRVQFSSTRHLLEPASSTLSPHEESPRARPAMLSRTMTSKSIHFNNATYIELPERERLAMLQKTRSVHAMIMPRRPVLSSGLRRSSTELSAQRASQNAASAPSRSQSAK